MGIETILAITAGVAGVASAGASVYSATKKPKNKMPITDFTKEREEAAQAEAERIKKMQGWRSTMVAPDSSLGSPSLFKSKLGE